MAGDWIKMRHDLRSDPAVILIAAELEIEEDLVVGKLHRFWTWADKQTTDGNAVGVTYSWLDRYLGVTGFAQSMQKAGWLLQKDDVLTIPKFDKHMSQSAKCRALTAKRVANYKVTHTPLPREEKRREEKNTPESPSGDSAVRFEEFWKTVASHKRKNKKAALQKYKQAVQSLAGRNGDQHAFLLDRAQAYYSSPLGQTPFCHEPKVWLNQGGYDDDPTAWERGTDGKPETKTPVYIDHDPDTYNC